MDTWHLVRRALAGIVAGVVALAAQKHGAPLGWSIAMGVGAAIIVASLFFPLVWKPRPPAPPEDK